MNPAVHQSSWSFKASGNLQHLQPLDTAEKKEEEESGNKQRRKQIKMEKVSSKYSHIFREVSKGGLKSRFLHKYKGKVSKKIRLSLGL